MSSYPINSFKYGLDTRRDVLDALPGTLALIENGFINAGGEIEKSKGFIFFAELAILDTNADQPIRGLESSDLGLVAFTSALAFGASVTQGQPTLASAAPAGITLVQLKHPSLYNDSTINYNRARHLLAYVQFSFTYKGKAFVGATFSDGNTFLYYDGALIQDSVNGMVLSDRTTLADLADDLDRQFEPIGWEAIANVNESGAVQNGSVIVNSPQSDYFAAINTENSVLGYYGNRLIDQDIVAVLGVRAIASFEITVNTGPFVITAPSQADTTTPTIDICGGSVAALGSVRLTAEAIAAAINDLTDVHGYSASNSGPPNETLGIVFVYAPLGYDVTVPLVLGVSGATTAVTSVSPTGMFAVLSPNPISTERVVSTSGTYTVGLVVSVAVTGATGGPTYVWSEVEGGTSGIIIVRSGIDLSGGHEVSFRKALNANTSVTGNFQVKITDSGGSGGEITKFFTVTLICTYRSGG